MERIVLRTIVCAVDLADCSEAALRRAWLLARLHGAELRVLHVTDRPPAPSGSVQRSVADVFLDLRRLVEAGSDGGAAVRWIVAHGDPALEVARHVRRANADLVVLGRSLLRLATGVVGTVTEAILRVTTCPVLLVPSVAARDVSPAPFREILCGVSSGLSTTTLRYALSLAQEFESRLTILNVENLEGVAGPHQSWVQSDFGQLRAAIPDTAHEWCEIDEFVGTGDPAQELTRVAERLNADLVVVGTAGSPACDRGLGSVAVGALPLPQAHVLIVPAPGPLRESATAPRFAHA